MKRKRKVCVEARSSSQKIYVDISSRSNDLGNHITWGAEKAPQVRFFLFERSDHL
jgi:hypothetical protein